MKIVFIAPGLPRVKRGTERFMSELSSELRKSGLDATCWGTAEAPGVQIVPVPSRIELHKFALDHLRSSPGAPPLSASAFDDWAIYSEDQLFAVPAAHHIQQLLDAGESLLAKVGGHLSYAIKVPFGVILPEARAHYVHEFENGQRALSVHFGADPDANSSSGPVSNFVVFTDPPDRSYYDYAAGVSAQFAFGISAFVDYNAVTSPDQRVHEVAFGLRFEYQVR